MKWINKASEDKGREYITMSMGQFINMFNVETTYSAMLKFIFLLLLLYVGKEIVCYVNKILYMDYIREHVISVTEQEPTLIADTIYNNIALYRKLDVKCIQRAVDCFGDSILKRDNWDLQINEKSSNISGGEKQKIAIIRQVVQDGQVMIFDEPTSAMDESGKKQFLQLIDQIKNHKIIIIVSHDNAILNTCDEILIL